MRRLQALSDAAHAAFHEALSWGDTKLATRLRWIVAAADRELDGTAHHPNCECKRCFSNMGDEE